MDFGHDRRFYELMANAAAEHASEYANCEAFYKRLHVLGPERSRAYAARHREFQECMDHADELDRYGPRRRPKRAPKVMPYVPKLPPDFYTDLQPPSKSRDTR